MVTFPGTVSQAMRQAHRSYAQNSVALIFDYGIFKHIESNTTQGTTAMMHPNMKRLLGLDGVKPVFHIQTWPTPVDIPTNTELKKERK